VDQELRELHATWLQRKDEKEQRDVAETEEREGEEEGEVAAGIPTEIETPVAFAPKDLPTTTDTGIPPPILQGVESFSVLHDVGLSSGAFTDDRTATVSSPTLSISSISDLTPTEFGEEIEESGDERVPTRHETFYLEDGNVEIVCGHTIFRVHSPIVSFSSPNLRDTLSPSTLLNAPMSEGCPRIVFKDSAEDFAVLLKMIYTPGHVHPPPSMWVPWADRTTDEQVPNKAQGSRIYNVRVSPSDGNQVRVLRRPRGTC